MLKEHKDPKQERGIAKRWFSDEYFDLFVWTDAKGIASFELCFEKQKDERAVAWSREKGFSRARIDQGEDNPSKNNSPIWTKDEGELDARHLVSRFEQAGGELDPSIYDFVRSKLGAL